MKLKSIISRLEKVTGKKVETTSNAAGTTTLYWIQNNGTSASWFENGIGSGDVRTIVTRPLDTGDIYESNQHCYDFYCRTIKAAADQLAN